MSKEDLPVIALCLTLAANLAMGAIRQADLKHKALIRSLFAAAGLLVALAAGWHWIKEWLPRVGVQVGEVAAHPVTWFVTGMFFVAALLFRKPNAATPAPAQSSHKSHDGPAQPDAATEARIAALDARIGQVDEKLRAAIHANAEAEREEGAARFEMIRKEAKHAIEQGHRREEAFDARLKAVAAAAESRTRDVFDAFRETYVPRFDELEGRLDDLASRIGGLREDMDRELLVRDVDAVLRELAEPITQLYRKVLRAEAEAYRDAHAWRFDVSQLQSKLERFWDIVNIWESTSPQPSLPLRRELMDVSRNDYAAVDEKPGPAVPDDFADQQLWRWVHVVAGKHIEHSEKALARIRKEARAV